MAQAAGRGRAGMGTGLALAAAALLARLPLLDAPLNRDEGAYASIARDLPRGDLPYRDRVEFKPPLLYAGYLPLAFGGRGSAIRLHALAALYHAANALLVWRMGLALLPARAAALAGLAYALGASDPSVYGQSASAETVMHLPLTASALLWWRALAAGSAPLAGLAGLLLGAAVLVKQQAVCHAGLIAFALLPRRRQPALSFAFAGGMTAAAAAAAAGLAAAGLLAPALDAWSWAARAIVGGVPWGDGLAALRALLADAGRTQGPLWLLAAAGLAAGRFVPRGRAFAGAWLACAAAAVLVGRRPYPHHLQQLLPPLALAAGAAVDRLLAGGRRVPAALRAAGGLAAAWGLLALWQLAPLAFADRAARADALYPENPFLQAEAVAAWVRAAVPPDGRVLVAGSEPEIGWLGGRRLAGRYPLTYHLTAPGAGIEAAQDAFLRGALAQRPAAAVFCDVPRSWADPSASPALIARLQARLAAELASSRWRRAADIPPFRLYTRKE